MSEQRAAGPGPDVRPSAPPLLSVRDLRVSYATARAAEEDASFAVDGVSFEVARGETLGVIGESGSGKSTVARSVLRLVDVTSGTIELNGVDVTTAPRRALRDIRRQLQIVFQDPDGSIDPRRTIGSSIAEPLRAQGIGDRSSRIARVAELLLSVGLDPAMARYRPVEFSGGERQRIGIARALAVEPQLIVCDEPVSALDVSVQASILNLLRDLQVERQLAYLFITHDIGVVRAVSDRVMVMNAGRVVEEGPADDVCDHPREGYTQQLIEAAMAGKSARRDVS